MRTASGSGRSRVRAVLNAAMVLASLGALSGCQTVPADSGSSERGTVDHIVYAVPDLDTATDALSGQLGITPIAGGEHPSLGTRNTLLSLGGRQYLEIIGPVPGSSEIKPFAASLANSTGPDILTFAVESNDLEEVVRVAEELGLAHSGITDGARRTLDGATLTYRAVQVVSEEFRGLVPFFIDWGATPHPGTTSPQGARLAEITAVHPKAKELAALYGRFGIKVPVESGAHAAILARIESGSRSVVLAGSAKGLGD